MNRDPGSGRAPDALRQAVERDLDPVRALPAPWARAGRLVPLALALLVGVPWMLGLRRDASALGPWWAWGTSAAQVIVGIMLMGLAMREAVPGRNLSRGVIALAFTGGLGVLVVVSLATFAVSPTTAPPALRMPYFSYCLRHSALLGAPGVIVAGLLAARALPVRPWVAGGIYGLGGGLMADAGWRLFCNVSSPSHVLVAHGGAVLLMVALGMATATSAEWARDRLDQRRRENTTRARESG